MKLAKYYDPEYLDRVLPRFPKQVKEVDLQNDEAPVQLYETRKEIWERRSPLHRGLLPLAVVGGKRSSAPPWACCRSCWIVSSLPRSGASVASGGRDFRPRGVKRVDLPIDFDKNEEMTRMPSAVKLKKVNLTIRFQNFQ